MLNTIWPIFIIISIVYSIFSGNISDLSNSIFSTLESTMTLLITMAGTMCFWSGIMNIFENTSIFSKIKNIITKFLKIVFKDLDKNSEKSKYISLNVLSNLLGLGNAATPMGIKAIECMNRENKNKRKLSKDMMLFILINTASIQIIPTTVISIRSSLGSSNPNEMIIHVWICTIVVFFTEVILGKILFKSSEE